MKQNIIWNAAGNLSYLFAQWLLTVFVTRLWGFGTAGVFSIALSVSATLSTLALFGIRHYQVSDVEERYPDTAYVTLRALTSLLSLLLCPITVLLLGYTGETLAATVLYMLFRLAECYSDVLHGISQKYGRLDLAGKGFAIKSVFLLVGFFFGYFLFRTLCGSLAVMTLFSFATTFLYDLPMAKRQSAFSLFSSARQALSLGKNTLALFVYLFLYSAVSTVAKYLIEIRFGEEILGAYSSIFAPALLITAAATYLYNPFTPTFAKLYVEGKTKEFLRLCAKIVLVLTVLIALCLPIAHFLGEWGLSLLFGESIRPYAYMLIPILLSVYGTALFGFFCMLAVTLRAFLPLLLSCVLCLGTTALFSLFLLWHIGENGASYGMTAAYLFASLLLFLFILRHLFRKGISNER